MYSYCTLFDKNYLDKGFALISSFQKYTRDDRMYVLAMDDICYEALLVMNFQRVIPIKLSVFETEELLKAKSERSRGEYCWTCASALIYYILTTYQEEYCTYVDADLYFYADPGILVEEMVKNGKSVQIIEHRFRQNFSGRFQQSISGRFCVEFNTFKNDKAGLELLDIWRKQALVKCGFAYGTEKLGDQMYLDEWPEQYSCVNILQNLGAGLAPWNLERYRYLYENEEGIWVSFEKKKEPVQVVFCHFHGLEYLDRLHVNIGVHKRCWRLDRRLVLRLYEEYLCALEKKKKEIEREFHFCPLVRGNALGITDDKSIQERIKGLFKGSFYQNIRSRIENHMRIVIFRKRDILTVYTK